jgi:hypothetical protein
VAPPGESNSGDQCTELSAKVGRSRGWTSALYQPVYRPNVKLYQLGADEAIDLNGGQIHVVPAYYNYLHGDMAEKLNL